MIRVKEAIKSSGLKQKFIAGKIGISETYLSLLLKGDYDMSDEIRLKIMSLCNAVIEAA
ncbi:helix-turn-helix transcriptional regulator [Candidatus Pacearchaeota archaeon]|nr:helix-turn-helix transcriptional regulator [Candidatus Pacearchaeota archaeon]